MAVGKLLHRECRLDPENVDRAVYARAIEQRYDDGCQPVVERRRSVRAADEDRITCGIAPGTCLGENTLEPLRLTCQTILWFVRLAQPTQNGFTFRIRTEREVGAAHAGEQPIRPRTD